MVEAYVPSAVHGKVISVHSRSPSPKLCLHKQTSGVINKPTASSTRHTTAKQVTGVTEKKVKMGDINGFDLTYVFIQIGLLQVNHFKLNPLQNLLQRLACFVIQLFT